MNEVVSILKRKTYDLKPEHCRIDHAPFGNKIVRLMYFICTCYHILIAKLVYLG